MVGLGVVLVGGIGGLGVTVTTLLIRHIMFSRASSKDERDASERVTCEEFVNEEPANKPESISQTTPLVQPRPTHSTREMSQRGEFFIAPSPDTNRSPRVVLMHSSIAVPAPLSTSKPAATEKGNCTLEESSSISSEAEPEAGKRYEDADVMVPDPPSALPRRTAHLTAPGKLKPVALFSGSKAAEEDGSISLNTKAAAKAKEDRRSVSFADRATVLVPRKPERDFGQNSISQQNAFPVLKDQVSEKALEAFRDLQESHVLQPGSPSSLRIQKTTVAEDKENAENFVRKTTDEPVQLRERRDSLLSRMRSMGVNEGNTRKEKRSFKLFEFSAKMKIRPLRSALGLNRK